MAKSKPRRHKLLKLPPTSLPFKVNLLGNQGVFSCLCRNWTSMCPKDQAQENWNKHVLEQRGHVALDSVEA